MGLVTKYGFYKGWQPSADAANAPDDALLRMDNLVFDELGVHALRLGSSKLNTSALATVDVRSLYAVSISGTKLRFAQGEGSVYLKTSGDYASLASGFDSSLDVQFGAYLGQAFMASGTIKKKYNGTALTNWGIDAPVDPPSITQAAPSSMVLASCDSGENTWTDNESASAATNVNGFDGTANGARQIQAAAGTFRGVMSRDIGALTDFSDYGSGVEATDNDIIEFYAKIDDPSKVSSITMVIDLNGSSAATYDRDTLSHTWPVSAGTAPSTTESITRQIETDYGIEGYLMREAMARILGRQVDTSAYFVRPELAGWQYFSAKRSEFTRVQTTSEKGWQTVRGVRLSFQGSGQGTVAFDRIRMVGGTATPLTGTYVWRAVYVREDTAYNALGVPSDKSSEVVLKNQGATLAVQNSTDDQVTHIWLYRMGGFLDAFYRVARVAVVDYIEANYTEEWEAVDWSGSFTALGQFSYTSDWEDAYVSVADAENGPANRTTTWEDEDYAGSAGFTNIADQTSDADALILNIRLETDNLRPPDNIIGISDDYYTRIFCLTSDGKLHPSRRLNPESFSAGQELRIGGPSEVPYWIHKSFGGLYVGTSRDIYRVSGTGAEYPDMTVDLKIDPLNINSPPINDALAWDGNILIYMAEDGPRLFQGETSTPLRGATDLLWRGYARHGVSAINIRGGRFRMAIADGVLKIITPEGDDDNSSSTLYAYHMAQQQWYRHTYGSAWRSIFREPDGTLVVGSDDGYVWELDDADATGDDGTGIQVTLWTRVDDFGMPFKPKRSESILMRLDTGGDVGTLRVHFDGNASSSVSATPTSSGMGLSSKNLGLIKYRQMQFRLTGTYTTFRFYGYTNQFIEAPESVEVFDSGPIDFGSNELVWVRSIRLKAQTESLLTVTPYLNGVAQSPKTITPQTTEAMPYSVDWGRELKAEQPRFVIAAPAGETFEPYWLEILYRAAGRMSQKKILRITA